MKEDFYFFINYSFQTTKKICAPCMVSGKSLFGKNHYLQMKFLYNFKWEDLFLHICPHPLVFGLFILLCCVTSVFPRCHTQPHSWFCCHDSYPIAFLPATFRINSVWSMFSKAPMFIYSPTRLTFLQITAFPSPPFPNAQGASSEVYTTSLICDFTPASGLLEVLLCSLPSFMSLFHRPSFSYTSPY